MNADRWALTVAGLAGQPWPMPPDMPGVVHALADRPLTADELRGIESPAELGLVLGISRQAAALRMAKQRQATATATTPAPPGASLKDTP